MNLYTYVKDSPINFTDPLGLWTIQSGPSKTFGALLGYTSAVGFVIGINPDTGKYEFGVYGVIGGGLYAGLSASAVGDFTYSRNKSIEDLNGYALTGGGSINVINLPSELLPGLGLSLGAERNIPLSEASWDEIKRAMRKPSELLDNEINCGTNPRESYTGSLGLGIGTPAEAHLFLTYTKILRIF